MKDELRMNKLMIIGISTTAELVFEFVKSYNLFDVVGFAVDREYKTKEICCGLPVYFIDEIEDVIDLNSDYIFVALFWNELNSRRKRLYERLKKDNKYKFANIVSPNAQVQGIVNGDNCWIHDYVVIQPKAIIGNDVFVMPQSLIAHHTIIADHCFCNTQSIIANSCIIEEQTFIGVHATVFEQTHIGQKCIVGACSVVKRNLAEFSVCKTPSDNMIIKSYPGDVIEQKLCDDKNIR